MIAILVADHGLSVRHACQVASLSRAAYYRPPPDRLDRDADVIAALTALVTEMPQWGFWMCFDALRNAGHRWNWKRVYRVYRALRLNLKRRTNAGSRRASDSRSTRRRCSTGCGRSTSCRICSTTGRASAP